MPKRVGSGKGVMLTDKGYLRVTHRHSPYHKWYVHRAVMCEAAKEFCFYPCNGTLPAQFTVHHIDGNKQNNCRCNLLLLQKEIHDFISVERAARIANGELQVEADEVPF